MVAGCGNKCVKYFFWIINFLFFVLGALILGIGIWIRVDQNFIANLSSTARVDLSAMRLDTIYYFLYVAIGIGAALLILGFFGCCGSCCESVCTISIYFFFVLVLFIIEIVAIILYFVNKNSLRDGFVNVWRTELVARYFTQDNIRTTLDNVQRGLQCCGASGCSDYIQYASFPQSCQCATLTQPGCANQVWAMLEANLVYCIIVAVIILIVELFAMVFSCVIISAVKEKRNQA